MSKRFGRVVPRGRGIEVRSALMLVAILVAGLVVLRGATTAPTFVGWEYPLLGNTHIVADFNGDGSLDLAGTGLPFVTIRLNNGAGVFGDAVQYPVAPTPNSAQDLAAGDFDGDGRLDLVVTLNDPVTTVSLITGNGDGTFNAPVNFPNTSGFGSPAVAAVDLNNDAMLDVVIAHDIACFSGPCVNTDLMSVMMGNGDGTFEPSREIVVGRGMSAIAVGDYNRDGVADLAIAGMQAQVYRLFGVGDGTFVQQPTLTVVEDTFFIPATDIDVADFNGDTIQDLVVAVPHNGSRTAIVIGNGDGTFGEPLVLVDPGLNIPQKQAVADFNGDGFQDLALSLGDGNTGLMQILNGNGDGTFQPRVMYLPPPPTSVGGGTIVAANLNGDSKPDIALARNGAFPGFFILINSTGVAPPPTPSAPTLLSPANQATVAQPITFDWTNAANAVSYTIQIDNSSNFTTPLTFSQTVSVSQITIGGLPAQQLWWRVRGRNSAGVFGPFSSSRRFTAQPAAASLSSVSVNPNSVVGGNASTGTATLTTAAPSGGAVVTLSSSIPSAATVPGSVTIAAGATSGNFTVSTVSVTASTSGSITGTFGGATRSAILTVRPPDPPPTPTSLGVSPSTVVGGNGSTGTIFLSHGPPPEGLVVSLSSSNTAAATVPASVTIFLSSGTFPISTLAVTTTQTTTITASANGVSRTAVLTVTPSAAAAALSAVSVNPTSVTGGTSSQGTVTLTAAAPAGGFTVALSDNSTAATVPASVSVAQGATSATFAIPTSAVTTSTPVTITANAGGITRTATLTVTPSAAPAALSAVSVNPTSVIGGASSQGTVTLTAAAPAGGFTVTLSDNSAAATVPASVSVAQGATSATFTIPTSAVTTSTPVTITANAGGVTRTATLTVNPAAQTATLSVTATGRGGERITSTPAGINVLVGTTGSASFTTGTSITLRATNDRDVIWSGACSSGGNKTKTCTFTLNGNASVTANVQ